jgi:hypothetical protein
MEQRRLRSFSLVYFSKFNFPKPIANRFLILFWVLKQNNQYKINAAACMHNQVSNSYSWF